MEPENIRFGGGPTASVLHPLVAVALLIAVVLILILPRKYVIIPSLLAIFLIPKGQQIVFAGVHLNVYRIIIMTGLARWIVSRRSAPMAGGFNTMDRVCTAFFLSCFVASSFLYSLQTQALVKLTGDLIDAFGGYIVMRFLIHDRDDLRRTIQAFSVIAMVNAICMMGEQRTHTNMFAFLGGVPDEVFRDGKLRSQGSFESFLTAGTYGATVIPLFIWLWSQAKQKMISAIGIVSATIMAITCFASTTLVGYAAGVGALFLWPVRKGMRWVRWAIVAVLATLHMVMRGPVWSILEHVDLTGSSSSYHRYMLIDTAIRHFGDWWFIGTKDNGSWGFDMWDVCNEYVKAGFNGGLLGFALFVAIISVGFSRLGKARKLVEGNRSEEWFLWCVGGALFAHVISFLGINYMDQMQFVWLALLASISVAVLAVDPVEVSAVQEKNPAYGVRDLIVSGTKSA